MKLKNNYFHSQIKKENLLEVKNILKIEVYLKNFYKYISRLYILGIQEYNLTYKYLK